MAEKDITEKILMGYNDIFSDIINVLLFNGTERVQPDSLEDKSPISQYKASDNKVHEEERDVFKLWKDGKLGLALYGLENETRIEKYMAFRLIGYDGASYRAQLLSEDEPKVPVISLVLYFGANHWTAPKTLHELVEPPEGLEDYFNDYKINVFEISWLTDEQVKMFKSDFGIVADFFVNKRKNPDYVPADKRTIKHVDEVLKLLSVMTGDNRYENILAEEGKESNQTMCDVAERLEKRGYDNGYDNGYETGRKDERIIIYKDLIKEGVYTPEQASKKSGIPEAELS